MAHKGLFSRKVVSAPVKPKPAKPVAPAGGTPTPRREQESPARAKKEKKPKWGTPEEKYRRLCMLCLLCRMTYYIHSKSLVSDQTYDQLELTIKEIEDRNRELIHPGSPSFHPGSEQERDYPRSAQMLWHLHKDDPPTWAAIEKAVVAFTREAREEFKLGDLMDSKNQKNSEKTS